MRLFRFAQSPTISFGVGCRRIKEAAGQPRDVHQGAPLDHRHTSASGKSVEKANLDRGELSLISKAVIASASHLSGRLLSLLGGKNGLQLLVGLFANLFVARF